MVVSCDTPLQLIPHHSGSVGSLNSTVSLMLPWPNCGKFCFVGSAGSRFEAVSSGGNRTSESRKLSRLLACPGFSATNASRAASRPINIGWFLTPRISFSAPE